MAQKKEWHYLDDEKGEWVGPLTLDELDILRRDGTVKDYTQIITPQLATRQGPIGGGISYSMVSRLSVEFNPPAEEFFRTRADKPTTVLSGPNNCGKTLLLGQLFSLVGHDGYLIACSRFSHIGSLNTRQQEEHEHRRYYDNFMRTFHTAHVNLEDNELKLEQIITGLKDSQRDKLFKIGNDLLGNEFSLKRTDPENTFSPFYVGMDEESLQHGSGGTRLLLTLLGILLDGRFSVILVDEPEIGLSPRIQAVIARFLYDPAQRQQYCPHLKQLYIATHSHLFLDRSVFSNNHTVTKTGSLVSVNAVKTVGDFHDLQFNLLGNELESIFLPSAIVIVEGESDVSFINRVAQLHIPERKIAIVRAGGDGKVESKLNVLKEAFGNLASSPYRDRLFIVLDKKNSLSANRIENQGVAKGNITVW